MDPAVLSNARHLQWSMREGCGYPLDGVLQRLPAQCDNLKRA